MYYTNGDSYVGNWVNDKKYGKGTHYFESGDRFECTYKEDGSYSGTYHLTDGSTHYESYDKNGNRII